MKPEDIELVQIVKEFRDGILDGDSPDGSCFLVCYPLEGYLSFLGYKVKLIKGLVDDSIDTVSSHCWIELIETGDIIDPTASQFYDFDNIDTTFSIDKESNNLMPEVYFGKLPSFYKITNS